MKRFLLILVLVFCTSLSLFAYKDSYAFLKGDQGYATLVTTLRHDGDEEKGRLLYESMKDEEPAGYSNDQRIARQCKVATSMARYLIMEADVKDKDGAKLILQEALEKTKLLGKDTFFRLSLESDIHSVMFLADQGDLSSGIASNNATKKAFKLYPDEYYGNFLTANTKLFAPGIAGGNVPTGCNMLIDIYSEFGTELSSWDLASVLSCIGIACYKLKDYGNAKAYLAAAKQMYPIDSQVDEYLAKKELT